MASAVNAGGTREGLAGTDRGGDIGIRAGLAGHERAVGGDEGTVDADERCEDAGVEVVKVLEVEDAEWIGGLVVGSTGEFFFSSRRADIAE